jgi:hypothetical protein
MPHRRRDLPATGAAVDEIGELAPVAEELGERSG